MVNAAEKGLGKEEITAFAAQFFRTKSGITLIKSVSTKSTFYTYKSH